MICRGGPLLSEVSQVCSFLVAKVFSQGEEGRGQASPPARQLHSSIGTRYRTSGFPGLRRRLRRCRRRKLMPRTKTRHILCAVCISHVNMQTLEVWMHEGEAAASPAKAGGRSRAVSGVRKKLKFLILAGKVELHSEETGRSRSGDCAEAERRAPFQPFQRKHANGALHSRSCHLRYEDKKSALEQE